MEIWDKLTNLSSLKLHTRYFWLMQKCDYECLFSEIKV